MNDSNEIWNPAPLVPDEASTPPARAVPRRAGAGPKAKIAGAMIVGGLAGAAIIGPLSAMAASPSPSAPTTTNGSTGTGSTGTGSTASPSTGTGATGGATATDPGHGPGGHGGPGGGPNEAVTDTSVVAKAIGISEADLITALQGGQTVAAVAKAHNVDVQVVIDALVADGQSELDAAVKAGTITQAQADAEKPELTQRATDQVNGTLGGGRH